MYSPAALQEITVLIGSKSDVAVWVEYDVDGLVDWKSDLHLKPNMPRVKDVLALGPKLKEQRFLGVLRVQSKVNV